MKLSIEIDVQPGSRFCGNCMCCYCDNDGHPFCGAFVTYLNEIGPPERLKRCLDQAADGNPFDAMFGSVSDLNGPVKDGEMTIQYPL